MVAAAATTAPLVGGEATVVEGLIVTATIVFFFFPLLLLLLFPAAATIVVPVTVVSAVRLTEAVVAVASETGFVPSNADVAAAGTVGGGTDIAGVEEASVPLLLGLSFSVNGSIVTANIFISKTAADAVVVTAVVKEEEDRNDTISDT